jgi:hypothetical protein
MQWLLGKWRGGWRLLKAEVWMSCLTAGWAFLVPRFDASFFPASPVETRELTRGHVLDKDIQ